MTIKPDPDATRKLTTEQRFDAVCQAVDARRTGELKAEARCPVHEGNRYNLSFRIGDKGYPVFTCHGPCKQRDRKEWLRELWQWLVANGVPVEALRATGTRQRSSRAPTGQSAARTPDAKPLPTETLVVRWVQRLRGDEERKADRVFLYRQRGLNRVTRRRYKIGWHYNRFTIPVRDADGNLVNVRRYKPGGKPKFTNEKGHGAAVLYPLSAG